VRILLLVIVIGIAGILACTEAPTPSAKTKASLVEENLTRTPDEAKIDIPTVTPVNESQVSYRLIIYAQGYGTTNLGTGTHIYPEGSQVSITATPADGWRFAVWAGDVADISPTIIIDMDSDKRFIACFTWVKATESTIQITYILDDYLVEASSAWSDEFVEITNLGENPQDLAGWELLNISEGYPRFIFPSYVLNPGEIIRVYANEIHSEWGGFSFKYGNPIWIHCAEETSDEAVLNNDDGEEVSRNTY
jgi:hypothetical protein